MRKSITIGVFFGFTLFFAITCFGLDVNYTFTNDLQYSLYSETYRDSLVDRMEATIGIGNLSGGILLETRQPLPKPSDFDRKIGFLHLRKRYVSLKKDGFSVRVGDFPVFFGRGLSINLFRDDNLPHDTEPEGVKLSYTGEYGSFKAFSGNINKRVAPLSSQDLSYEIDDTKNHIIRGAYLSTKPFDHFIQIKYLEPIDLGMQYVRFRSLEELPESTESREYRRQMIGVDMTYNHDYFDFYTEMVGGEERELYIASSGEALETIAESDTIQGLFAAFNGYISDFTLSAEFKDYKGLNFTDSQQKPYNSAPTVITEHTSRLLGRYLYTLHMDNERGYKIDFSYSPTFVTDLTLNYTKATDRENEEDYFWETYLEAKHSFDTVDLSGMINKSENNRAGEENGERLGGWIKATYHFLGLQNITLNAEYLKNDRTDLSENAFTLAYSGSPEWTIMLNYETSSDVDPYDGNDNWFSAEINYSFSHHFLRLFYGARRWGMNCNGGVCTIQPAFEGFELQLISNF